MAGQTARAEDAQGERPAIDREHLSRMTAGDAGLERELLALFATQSALLLARMQASEPAGIAALAHTLKGSALGVGAPAVAAAAEAVERAGPEQPGALLRLAVAVEAARAAIAGMLAPPAE